MSRTHGAKPDDADVQRLCSPGKQDRSGGARNANLGEVQMGVMKEEYPPVDQPEGRVFFNFGSVLY